MIDQQINLNNQNIFNAPEFSELLIVANLGSISIQSYTISKRSDVIKSFKLNCVCCSLTDHKIEAKH